MSLIVAGTGHRPNKLGGYDEKIYIGLRQLAMDWIAEKKPTQIISGMALGWDQALAAAAYYSKVPFIAAVPCRNQARTWPAQSQLRYEGLLKVAEDVHILSEDYTPSCMQDRNEWMVDSCDLVLALWNGSSGGTRNCIDYAKNCKKPIVNLYSEWTVRCPS